MVKPRGKSWQAGFTINGRRYRKDFTTLEDAEQWERETRRRIDLGGSHNQTEAVTAAVAAAGTPKTLGELKDRTYERHWKHAKAGDSALFNANECLDILGATRPITAITETALDGLIKELKERGHQNGTINRKMSALSKMLTFAFERDWIRRKPKFERLKECEHRIRWLTPVEEAAALYWLEKTARLSMKDFVAFLVDTGLRLSEGLNLTFSDAGDGWVRVWGDDSKTGFSRSVPLTDRAKEIIERRLKAAEGQPKVFHDLDYWGVQHCWKTLREAMDLSHDSQFVLHTTRHTCASRLIQQGVGLLEVKEILGHKALQTTMRYAHLHKDSLKAAMAKLNGYANMVTLSP